MIMINDSLFIPLAIGLFIIGFSSCLFLIHIIRNFKPGKTMQDRWKDKEKELDDDWGL